MTTRQLSAQLEEYWKQLDRESDRLTLVDIGRSEEGRTWDDAVITDRANAARPERQETSQARSAPRAHGRGSACLRVKARLSSGSTAVCTPPRSSPLAADRDGLQLVSQTDDETMRILRDVIVLLVHANPDGHELVANWYMREKSLHRRTLSGLPRRTRLVAGHDNNRDFYMGTQAETINMSASCSRSGIPQIVYDHHQAPPTDALMVAPPSEGPRLPVRSSRQSASMRWVNRYTGACDRRGIGRRNGNGSPARHGGTEACERLRRFTTRLEY